ncbi:MAG: hypothetical protein IKV86_00435 [Clostridia bacterium]|nr:hypothetical protein [Clostridia bacterium]
MGNIPIGLLGNAAKGVAVFCFVIFIWSLILCILKIKNTKFEGKKNVVIVSVASIVVFAASWIMNMGWMRFIMTLLSVPLIYAAIFFTINIVAGKYFKSSPILKWCNVLYVLTFIAANVLYPDVAGTVKGVGDTYFLFGYIRNLESLETVQQIANILIVVHAVLFVVQLVLIGMAKNTDEVPAVEEKEEVAEIKE